MRGLTRRTLVTRAAGAVAGMAVVSASGGAPVRAAARAAVDTRTGTAALLAPGISAARMRALVLAQDDSSEDHVRAAYEGIDGLQRVAYRSFSKPSIAIGAPGSGTALVLFATASEFEDADAAASAVRDIGDAFPDAFIRASENSDIRGFEDAEEVSMPRLGDKRYAISVSGDQTDTPGVSMSVVTVTVQIDTIVQSILTMSLTGPGADTAIAIAETTDGRWPDDARETQEDGLTVGGLWSALPTADDVPEDLVFDEEFETEF